MSTGISLLLTKGIPLMALTCLAAVRVAAYMSTATENFCCSVDLEIIKESRVLSQRLRETGGPRNSPPNGDHGRKPSSIAKAGRDVRARD